MQCECCSHEDTTLNLVKVTLKKEKLEVIIKNVPAEICEVCGETIFSKRIRENMMELARGVVSEKGLEKTSPVSAQETVL